MSAKKRLDVLLVERGLAESRSQAQALVLAGRVKGHAKAGEQVEESAELEIAAGARFVSRGGEKLAAALEAFGLDVAGEGCLDVGASTGGFTDCLLQAGAASVIALDVGYGQLDHKLRYDERVVVMERINARHLEPDALPEPASLITIDVSFISLAKVMPALLPHLSPGGLILALIKPQLEDGRGVVGKGGILRDEEVRRQVVEGVVLLCEVADLEAVARFQPPGVGCLHACEQPQQRRLARTVEAEHHHS